MSLLANIEFELSLNHIRPLVEQIATAGGLTLVEAADQVLHGISPEDYNVWLDEVVDQLADVVNDTSRASKQTFANIAFDILDNDSKLDMIASQSDDDVERLKRKIVTILWQSYKSSNLQKQVEDECTARKMRSMEDEQLLNKQSGEFAGDDDQSIINRRSDEHFDDYDSGVSDIDGLTMDDIGGEFDELISDNSDFDPDETDLEQLEVDQQPADDDNNDQADRIAELEQRLAELERTLSDVSLPHPDNDDNPDQYVAVGRSRHFDDEQQSSQAPANIFRQAVTAPKHNLDATLKEIEDEGCAAWKQISMPNNPHPTHSPAHKAWQKGFMRAARDQFYQEPRQKPAPIRQKPSKKR